MAMVRLPTSMSDGKANLHQGAIGVGVDIGTGNTSTGVCNGKPIKNHPDTSYPFDDLIIPGWNSLLRLAAGCYEMTGLGYIGIDIIIDNKLGPMILELNARPGLSIQVANSSGLLPRLRQVEEIARAGLEVRQRVDYVKQHFSKAYLSNFHLPNYFL